MSVLLTGGLGYIGSHTACDLLDNGREIVVLDNLSNSSENVKEKIEKITGKTFKFYKGDARDEKILEKIFTENEITAVIHFAGLKAVGESVEIPLSYYDNNLFSTITVLNMMNKFSVKNFVFSSSATVYGRAKTMPISEECEVSSPASPYGKTKLFIEEILKDLFVSDPKLNIAILRYFNPIGAHDSGLIGEDPNGIPNNLMPYIARVATGKLEKLKIFGNDYPTLDGTCIRDYIHVVDLAEGHRKALEKLEKNSGLVIYNLGTGIGYSVLDIVNAFNKVCGDLVEYEFAPRRLGDIDVCYSTAKKAEEELGWKAKRDLVNMCKTSYNFQEKKNEEK